LTPVFPEKKQGSGPDKASANQALERTAGGRRSASAFTLHRFATV